MLKLGTNRTISFGDYYLGLLTFLASNPQEVCLYIKRPEHAFLKEWFPHIKDIRLENSNFDYDIHLHSEQYKEKSRWSPWGYFINHQVKYNPELFSKLLNITGNDIPELKADTTIFVTDMGSGMSLDYHWIVSILNNLNDKKINWVSSNKYDRQFGIKNSINHISLQDLLYNVYTKNIRVISYRNGLCDFFYTTCDNELHVIYPSPAKYPTWIKESILNTDKLDLVSDLVKKRKSKTVEYNEESLEDLKKLLDKI